MMDVERIIDALELCSPEQRREFFKKLMRHFCAWCGADKLKCNCSRGRGL